MLVTHIETGPYRRQGKAITNFHRSLPSLQSDWNSRSPKIPTTFDFLTPGPGRTSAIWSVGLWNICAIFCWSSALASHLLGANTRFE